VLQQLFALSICLSSAAEAHNYATTGVLGSAMANKQEMRSVLRLIMLRGSQLSLSLATCLHRYWNE
jgi:hypothetical protein